MGKLTVEIEESVDRKAFVSIMGELVNALGKGNLDVSFPLNETEVNIPAVALKNAKFEVEYEESDEDCELELTIEWKK